MRTNRYIWQNRHWPNFVWNSEELLPLLSECRRLQGRLFGKISSVGIELGHQAQADILLEEALKTSAIEGEKLNAAAVRSSIARRLGLPYAGLPVDRRTDGLVEVLLDATQNYRLPLTKKRLFGWHAALFPTGYSGLHKIAVGRWRGPTPMRVVSGPVGRETVHFEAPPADRIETEITRFLNWWDESPKKLEGILRGALAHFWFVTIHPFEDGNGRIARALTDMALAQDDTQPLRYYSLSSQIMAEREAYYNVLEARQKGGMDVTDWMRWFLGCYSRAIVQSGNLLSIVFDKARFWQRNVGISLNDRQRKVINRLLDAGRDGFAGGLTNRKYASIAGVSRATALREIQDLQRKGILLQRPGKGRSVSYDLIWNEAEK